MDNTEDVKQAEDELKLEYHTLVQELTGQVEGRMSADSGYRNRVYWQLAGDAQVVAALIRQLRDAKADIVATRRSLQALETMELDSYSPEIQATLRDLISSTDNDELRLIATTLIAQHGTQAVSSPGMTDALLQNAQSLTNSALTRRWSVAALASVARSEIAVRLALSKIACSDPDDGVSFEAIQALTQGSSLLRHWADVIRTQPIVFSALLYEIAARGARSLLGFIPWQIGDDSLPLIAHLTPSDTLPPDSALPTPISSETDGLQWEVSIPETNRLRMTVSKQDPSDEGQLFQVFETGKEVSQPFGFIGYLLLHPDSANQGRLVGALEWNAARLPTDPEWVVFHAVESEELCDEDWESLQSIAPNVATMDPEAVPFWERWLNRRPTGLEQDELESEPIDHSSGSDQE